MSYTDQVIVNTGLTPNGRLMDNTPDGNAIRWIEIRKNLGALRTLYGKANPEDEESFKSIKRLMRTLFCNGGFYLDKLDYARTMADLDPIMNEAIAISDAKVMETWKPGMPGYGIETLAEIVDTLLKKTLYHGTEQKLDVIKPLGINMGTRWSKPEWATFFWDQYELARKWAVYQYCRRTTKHRIFYHIPSGGFVIERDQYRTLVNDVKGGTAYVYQATLPRIKLSFGSSPAIQEFTYPGEVIPEKTTTIRLDDSVLSAVALSMSSEEIDAYLKQLEAGAFNNRRGLLFKWIMDPDRDFERHKYHKLVRQGKLSPGDDLTMVTFESTSPSLQW